MSLLKPFYFCIKGREAVFFFFWVIFILPKSEKCPNQIGGQVATGNHSTKPVFFFFPFLSETPCRRKVNGMSVDCSTYRRATDSFNTQRTKQKITLGPNPETESSVCLSVPGPFNLGLLFVSLSKWREHNAIFEFQWSEYSEDKINAGFYLQKQTALHS